MFIICILSPATSLYSDTLSGKNVADNFNDIAQDKIVKGQVLHSVEKLPIVGVNVAIIRKGKVVSGVITDVDGFFSINVPKDCQIKFSFIGYKDVILTPKYNGEMKVIMEEDAALIDEVVVNGFFSRSKQTFTGAANTYSSKELLSVSPVNVLQALAALDPGMSITQNNAMGSNPNSIPDLVIRSTTSLATNNETGLNSPLIVIDGVESTLQALYDIDIHDIEKVNVLKDASATALYGENAANGVIIIERKKVVQSPVRIRYTFTPEMSFADLSSYDLCNASQKLELEKLAGLYNVNESGTVLKQEYYDKLSKISQGVNTDWINKPVRNSFSQNHSISVSGRGSGLDYNISGNYSNKLGVMKDDVRDRYGVNVFLSYTAIDKLIVTLRGEHNSVNTKDSKYGDFSNYLQANPYDSPYDENGNYASKLSFDYNNPLYEASLKSFRKTQARYESISLDARYNFKPNLYITAQGAMSTSRGTGDVYVSPKSNNFATITNASQKGSYLLTNDGTDDWSSKIVGNWIQNFDNEGTMLTLNAGGEIKHYDAYNRYLAATGFLSDDLADISYATSYPNSNLPGGSEDVSSSVGCFLAANFIYKNKYIVDGSYRLSGSSKFGENNRYAPFWSTGVGYNIHNEKFIKKLDWIDLLRVRGSYGYTGSVKFDAYQAITTYHYSTDYIHYAGVGAIPYAMSNPDLTWQTTKKLNLGLTSSFFKNRLNFNFDYYNEKTDDMLVDVSLPPSSGAVSVKNNLGSQSSIGFEYSIWAKILKTKDWELNLSLNGLHSKTKINNISDALKRKNESNASNNYNVAPLLQFREGESPTTIYAVRSAGIDPASGKEIFIKKDGTYTYNYDAKDQVGCGDTNPFMQGSFSTNIGFKQFYLTMNFSYRFGGDMYNSTRASKIENINPMNNADIRALEERWHKPGDLSHYLNISTTGGKTFVHTDRFIEKDNELWLSNVNLQYYLSDSFAKSVGLQKIYLGLGAEDIFRLTSAKYERGTYYPYSRSINFSLSVTL